MYNLTDFQKTALLDSKRFSRNVPGSLNWLVDGAGFFPELDRQIAQARESISLIMTTSACAMQIA